MPGGGGKDSGGGAGNIGGMLSQAASQAASYANQYGQMGIDELKQMYQTSQQQYQQYFNQGQAQTAPYRQVGANALDDYAGTLGVSTPTGGSFQLQQLLTQQAQNQAAQQASASPASNTDFQSRINQYLPGAEHMANVLGGGGFGGSGDAATDIGNLDSYKQFDNNNDGLGGKIHFLSDVANRVAGYGNLSEHAAYTSANKAGIDQLLSDYNNSLKAPATPAAPPNTFTAAQQAVLDNYKNGTDPGTAQTAQQTLNKFGNTGQAQLVGYDSTKSLIDNFKQNDPAYQFRLQQGINSINAAGSAGGYLNSPNLAKGLADYGQGLASTEFNNYQGKLMTAFGSYQNSLAQLAGLGANASQASSTQTQQQGQTLGNSSTQLGQNVAGVYQNIGDAYSNSVLAAANATASSYANQANINNQSALGYGQLGGALGTAVGGPVGGIAGGLIGAGLGGGK